MVFLGNKIIVTVIVTTTRYQKHLVILCDAHSLRSAKISRDKVMRLVHGRTIMFSTERKTPVEVIQNELTKYICQRK